MSITLIMAIVAIIAGFFGGFVGNMIVSFYTKSWDFKFGYKKYILEKRQAAYTDVETIMIDLGNVHTDAFYKGIPAIFYTKDDLTNFQDKVATAILKHRVWLSADMLQNLYEIQELNWRVDKDFENSKRHHKSIDRFRDAIYRAFFHDIRKLDNVTEFKNTKLPK